MTQKWHNNVMTGSYIHFESIVNLWQKRCYLIFGGPGGVFSRGWGRGLCLVFSFLFLAFLCVPLCRRVFVRALLPLRLYSVFYNYNWQRHYQRSDVWLDHKQHIRKIYLNVYAVAASWAAITTNNDNIST